MIRIYSPLKQFMENDPQAFFIKKWVPELAFSQVDSIHKGTNLPATYYPKPIVDMAVAIQSARVKLFAQFKDLKVRLLATDVQARLGSRSKAWKKKPKVAHVNQQLLTKQKQKPRSRIPQVRLRSLTSKKGLMKIKPAL